MGENQVSLQIYLGDNNVLMCVHVYTTTLNYMYSKYIASGSLSMSHLIAMFILARFI